MISSISMEKLIFSCLVLFSLSAFTSVGGQSIFSALAVLLMIIDIAWKKNLPSLQNVELKGVGLFFLAIIVSTCFSFDPARSFGVLIAFTHRFLIFFPALFYVKTKKQVACLIATTAFSLAVADAYAIYQWFNGSMRPQSFISHPAIFGDLLTIAVPFILSQVISAENIRTKVAMGGIFILSIIVLLANATRSAWLGIAILPAVIFLVKPNLLKKGIVVALIGLVLLSVGVGVYTNSWIKMRFESLVDPSYNSNFQRVILWKSAVNLWEERPVTGVGMGNFGYYFEKYVPTDSEFYNSPANSKPSGHSTFFTILAEAGSLGVAAFFYMYYSLIRQHFRAAGKSRNSWKMWQAMGALLFTTAMFFQGIIASYNIGVAVVVRPFWFMTALAFAAYRIADLAEANTADRETRL